MEQLHFSEASDYLDRRFQISSTVLFLSSFDKYGKRQKKLSFW